MKVLINKREYDLADHATVLDAIAALDAKPPFAAAVNTEFVPKAQYGQRMLHEGDDVEIISPITGG